MLYKLFLIIFDIFSKVPCFWKLKKTKLKGNENIPSVLDIFFSKYLDGDRHACPVCCCFQRCVGQSLRLGKGFIFHPTLVRKKWIVSTVGFIYLCYTQIVIKQHYPKWNALPLLKLIYKSIGNRHFLMMSIHTFLLIFLAGVLSISKWLSFIFLTNLSRSFIIVQQKKRGEKRIVF